MFDIEYKGGNTIVLSAKKATLVTDPRQSVIGLKDLILKDAIELATENRFALNSENARLSIEGPGEYEIADFSIRGIPARRHIDSSDIDLLSTIYRIEVGTVRIGLLGNVSPVLSEDQLEGIGVIDILVVPVGGNGYTLDATSAAGIVRQVEPKVVIPVHYADEALAYEVPQEEVEVFIKELGAPLEVVPKYKIKGPATIPEVLTVVQLERG